MNQTRKWDRVPRKWRLKFLSVLQVSVETQTASKLGQESKLLKDLATDIDYFGRKQEIPKVTRNELYAPYPNPFNPRTKLRYDVYTPARVQLMIFDVRGRRVSTLVDQVQARGPYELTWLGNDDRGRSVASGVYFLRLSVGQEEFLRRLALVR